jgi:DNA-binding MarR family transcriptional regulator
MKVGQADMDRSQKLASSGVSAMPAQSATSASDYLTQRIGTLAKLMERNTTRMLADFGLSIAEWRVLAHLARHSTSTVRLLADQLFVDRAEASRAAASLIRRRYVKREDNPADRRSPRFSCTPKGVALFREITPLRERFHGSLIAQLTPDQVSGLEVATDRLTMFLDAELRKPGKD